MYPRIGTLAAVAAIAIIGTAQAQPIRIGEINSYKAQAAFLEPYRKGLELAAEEINASGGVSGRPLELVIRDDGANPADAVRIAEELLAREKVDFLAGSMLSNVGLALANFAKQKRVFFLASEALTDKLVWDNGNRYTFRLRTSTHMQVGMLVREAVRPERKRWALVYPDYEYGQAAAKSFRTQLRALQPDVQFVGEQAVPLGKIDAGAVVDALVELKPDAIFNATFGADLGRFVRAGNVRGLFKDRLVVSLLTGEPEYLAPLRDEAPEGWVVTGYPWYGIDTPAHKAFLAAYLKRYGDYPRMGSVIGYSTIQALAAGLRRARSTHSERLVWAFEGLWFDTPLGKAQFRASDHQSTLGTYVGTTTRVNGVGRMKDYTYREGSLFLPPEADALRRRPYD